MSSHHTHWSDFPLSPLDIIIISFLWRSSPTTESSKKLVKVPMAPSTRPSAIKPIKSSPSKSVDLMTWTKDYPVHAYVKFRSWKLWATPIWSSKFRSLILQTAQCSNNPRKSITNLTRFWICRLRPQQIHQVPDRRKQERPEWSRSQGILSSFLRISSETYSEVPITFINKDSCTEI